MKMNPQIEIKPLLFVYKQTRHVMSSFNNVCGGPWQLAPGIGVLLALLWLTLVVQLGLAWLQL